MEVQPFPVILVFPYTYKGRNGAIFGELKIFGSSAHLRVSPPIAASDANINMETHRSPLDRMGDDTRQRLNLMLRH